MEELALLRKLVHAAKTASPLARITTAGQAAELALKALEKMEERISKLEREK